MPLTMRWERCGSTFVIAHSDTAPTNEDYDQTLSGYHQHLGLFNKILISSGGGAPNSSQRKKTTEFWKGKIVPKTAIMTSSRMARGVITALGWLMPSSQMVGVDFDDFPSAFRYLELPVDQHSKVIQVVIRLRKELESSPDLHASV
jgi:hypothetical protein